MRLTNLVSFIWDKMLLASDALFALVLFFSFAEISQISGNQPRNGVDGMLRLTFYAGALIDYNKIE